jgi:hypothetical protein
MALIKNELANTKRKETNGCAKPIVLYLVSSFNCESALPASAIAAYSHLVGLHDSVSSL